MEHGDPTVSLRLHTLLEHSPLLREGFGRVPVTINGKHFMATITRSVASHASREVDLWMEPDGPKADERTARGALLLADLGQPSPWPLADDDYAAYVEDPCAEVDDTAYVHNLGPGPLPVAVR